MKNTVFNTFGFPLHAGRFVYLEPGESGPSAATEAAAAEAAKEAPKSEQKSAEYEAYAKEIAELGGNVPPERFAEMKARLDKVDERIGQDANLSQTEKNELQNRALRARNKFEETISATFRGYANEAEAYIAETFRGVLGGMGDAGKMVGRGVSELYKYPGEKWAERDVALTDAAKREVLQSLAGSPEAQAALAKMNEADALTKKVAEATAMAEKYAKSGWRGQEVNGKKIDTYTGADVKIQGETKNYTILDSENVTQGMLIAAYMLGGEAEVQKVVEMLATGQKGDGVNAKVDIATMNDYENSGVGGAAFGKFEKDHDEVGSPLNAFATMYLSKAKKTLSPEQYNEYAADVDTKLAALNLAIKNGGNADILRSKFMAEAPTPDKFLKDKAPKAAPTPEPAAPVPVPASTPMVTAEVPAPSSSDTASLTGVGEGFDKDGNPLNLTPEEQGAKKAPAKAAGERVAAAPKKSAQPASDETAQEAPEVVAKADALSDVAKSAISEAVAYAFKERDTDPVAIAAAVRENLRTLAPDDLQGHSEFRTRGILLNVERGDDGKVAVKVVGATEAVKKNNPDLRVASLETIPPLKRDSKQASSDSAVA